MDLAHAFYQSKLNEIAATANCVSHDYRVNYFMPGAVQGQPDAIGAINQQIANKITMQPLGGTQFIAVLDKNGEILTGRVLSMQGDLSPAVTKGNWGDLPIVTEALSSGDGAAATEVIPVGFLQHVGLESQAYIPLLETPKAAEEPYDPREGSAGFALTSVYPVKDDSGQVIGAVMVAHLFNNDFTLVDRIKEVAGVDTATICRHTRI
jgi:hypothetical protein